MPAIKVERLSKEYRIGTRDGRSDSIRELVAGALRFPFRKLSGGRGEAAGDETIWALKEVSFEIGRGEAVGIIGRNGAGKSTLLKILSRITEPTSGRAVLRGRVGSLLEVGTGFHPELTGRENVFLNGAILGMRRAEIRAKFDEIVAFSGVERFLDTPVKRYSSGMHVRLAFAVAAHLESDIVIVDEVLAVGDAAFQKKCLGKMDDVMEQGRTVLFVSHQMAAVQSLCRKALWLEEGRVAAEGGTDEVIARYIRSVEEAAARPLSDRRDRRGNGSLRFSSAFFGDGPGDRASGLQSGRDAVLRIGYENPLRQPLRNVLVSIGVDNQLGERILWLSNELTGEIFPELPAEGGTLTVRIPRLPLSAGSYGYTLFCSVNGEIADWIQGAGRFSVEAGDFYGTGHLPPAGQGQFLADVRFGAEPR